MPTIQIGRFRLTGVAATLVLLAMVAGIAALVMRHRPSPDSWPMFASMAIWAVCMAYWGRVARNVAPDQRMESIQSRQIHQLMVNGSLLLLFIPVPGLRLRVLPAAAWQIPVGLAVQLMGALLAVWARWHLGRNWSGRVSIKVDHELIRSGPYRLLRHPIYTGFLLMYLGPALITCELHGLIAVLIVVFAYWRKIGIEETALEGAFGERFAEYRRKTWALLPLVY